MDAQAYGRAVCFRSASLVLAQHWMISEQQAADMRCGNYDTSRLSGQKATWGHICMNDLSSMGTCVTSTFDT